METFAMVISNLLGGLLCLTLGLLIRTGKVNFLIAGYNTMNKEQQAAWNTEALYKFVSRMLTLPAIILLIGAVLIFLDFFPFAVLFVTWGLFIAAILFGVIYLNTNPRFRRIK